MIVKRRNVLSTLALLAATPTVALGQSLTPLRYGSAPLVDGVPVFYAQQSGMFRREGLDVTISKLPNSSAIAAALLGGSLDVGEVSALPLVYAHMRGLNLEIVYPLTIHYNGRPYNAAILVASGLNYKTAKDLNGQTMSSAAVGDSAWLATKVFIDTNGGDSSTIKFIEVPYPALAAAIEAGRVIGGVSVDPYLSQAVASGKVKSVGDLQAGFGLRLIQSTYSATSEFVAKNRDAMVRFARVVRAAQDYMNSHRNELAKYTEQFTGVDPAQQSPQGVNFTTNYTPKDFQPWIDAAVKYKVIDKGFDAADLFAKLPS